MAKTNDKNNNKTKKNDKKQQGKKQESIRVSIPGTDIVLPDWDFEVYGMKFNIRPVVKTSCGFTIVNPKTDLPTFVGSSIDYKHGEAKYYPHEIKLAFVAGTRRGFLIDLTQLKIPQADPSDFFGGSGNRLTSKRTTRENSSSRIKQIEKNKIF